MYKVAATVIIAFVLAACSTGTKIKWDNARQVRAGMTTEEVSNIMGKPYSITSLGDGNVRWIWVYVNSFTMGSQSASLTFKDGKVVKAFEIPDSF